jgi:hypothetical protein
MQATTRTKRADGGPQKSNLEIAETLIHDNYEGVVSLHNVEREIGHQVKMFQTQRKGPAEWGQMVQTAQTMQMLGNRLSQQSLLILGLDMLEKKLRNEREAGTLTREPSPEREAGDEKAAESDPPDPRLQTSRSRTPMERPQIVPRVPLALPLHLGDRAPTVKREMVRRRRAAAAGGARVLSPFQPPRTARQRQQSLTATAQATATGMTSHTSYTHLIHGDLAPVGRVHLVSLGPDTGDQREQHILTQLDADANMGAQNLRQRSRRGPFRQSTGRSRVMDRSAHVAYRRRGHTLEITIRRGVTEYEIEVLIGKLSSHRMASQRADLYIISSSRKKLGDLDRIDMSKLRTMIDNELKKRATIGLLVQDCYTKGLLHKGYSHSMDFTRQNLDMMKSSLFAN